MRSVIPQKIHPVVSAIRDAGGCPFLVGGAVRDALRGAGGIVKDLDFEVYHISIERLIDTLSAFGTVETVGSSFGVIKLFMSRELDLDFALPRRESKTGRGHRGFVVSADPDMPPREACARRDFTINAMLMDPVSGDVLDFFGGQADLANRILRHTSAHFSEDPLRPLRGMQFASRFNMRFHDETTSLCRSLETEALSLAEERIFAEWEKWALYAISPARGLQILADIEWDRLFGELTALKKVTTPETGCSKWEETLTAVEKAMRLAESEALDRGDRLVLMFSALCHALRDEILDVFLSKQGVPLVLSKRIVPLLDALHRLTPEQLSDPCRILRLSVALKPESIRNFAKVLSCTPSAPPTDPGLEALVTAAEGLGVADGPPRPLVTGKLLKTRGIMPGPQMGKILKFAYDAQLDRCFLTPTDAAAWLETWMSELSTRNPQKT